MRSIITLIILLISVSSYSENKYPKKLIFESDTVVLITPTQLIQINCKLIDLDKCREELTLLTESNKVQDELISNLESNILLKNKEISLLNSKLENYEKTIKIYNEDISKTKRKSLVISGISITIGVVSLITLIAK